MIAINKYKRMVHVNMMPPMCEVWKGSCHNPVCDIRPLRIINVGDVLEAVAQLRGTKEAAVGLNGSKLRAQPALSSHPA
jgi:hypothetical protein